MEEFILKKIKELEEGVKKFKKGNPIITFHPALHILWGQIDILHLCLKGGTINPTEESLLKKIKELEERIIRYKENNITVSSLNPDFILYRLYGQRDILYLCITAHNNNYEKDSK